MPATAALAANTNTVPPGQRPAFAPWLGQGNDVTAVFLAAGQVPGLINLGGGLPDPAPFPTEELAELAAQGVRSQPQDCLG